MEIEIVNASNSKPVTKVSVSADATVLAVKHAIAKQQPHLYVERQSLRNEPKSKPLSDRVTLASLNVTNGARLYFKDLGPQIAWKTVFLVEYAGPLFVYLWLYTRPYIFYGSGAHEKRYYDIVHVAAACWSLHYIKRLLETLFVHRFSHATMPLRNLFKNSSYYWLFAMYVAYHVNHPLYTPPNALCSTIGLAAFVLCELGNLSIHLSLRQLRPAGTNVRRIPVATANVFTSLFNHVSCPNYTYEIGSWIAFTLMTSCLPAGLFMLAGAYQMTVWALGKHRNYKKEFADYPKSRKAIIPFVL